MKERFEVIMPVYIITEELKALTEAAIESLGDVELIIIDNASLLGGGMLRSKATTYIRNNENMGYAKAVNQGLMLGHVGSYLAIANNDIRVSPNWKAVAKEVLLNDKAYSCHFRMIPYEESIKYGTRTVLTGRERWCTSSFFVLNPTYQKFLFDENLWNSYTDYDYWHKVRSEGLYTAYTTKACYQHKDSSTQQLLPDRAEMDKKNYEYFKQKWGEYPDIMFAKQFPEQMKKDWRQGLNEM